MVHFRELMSVLRPREIQGRLGRFNYLGCSSQSHLSSVLGVSMGVYSTKSAKGGGIEIKIFSLLF